MVACSIDVVYKLSAPLSPYRTHLSVEWLVEDFPFTNADTWKVEEDCWFSILQGNLGCASSFSTSYETNDEVKNGRDNVDSILTSISRQAHTDDECPQPCLYDQPIETWANIIAPLEPKTRISREWVPVAHVVLFVVNAVLAVWAFMIGTERGRKMATFVRRLAKNDAKVEDTITSLEEAELEMFASSSESTLYDGCENKRREAGVPPQHESIPAQGREGPSRVIEVSQRNLVLL